MTSGFTSAISFCQDFVSHFNKASYDLLGPVSELALFLKCEREDTVKEGRVIVRHSNGVCGQK